MCNFNSTHRYNDYMRAVSPQIPKIHKSVEKRLKFVLGRQKSGDSDGSILPIWSEVSFDRLEYD